MADTCPNAHHCDVNTCGCDAALDVFRAQLGVDEPLIDGVQLDLPEAKLPGPERSPEDVFGLGYAVGRSTVEAEQAAAAVFARARRRRLVLDALAVGAGWFLGSLIAERVQS